MKAPPIIPLALCLLPWLSHSLRTEQPGEKHLKTAAAERGVPPGPIFKRLWEARARLETGKNIYMPNVKVVLGVFATQDVHYHRDVHDVIIRTWMNKTGVCWLHQGRQEGCSIYVAFVLGGPVHNASQEDVVLNISENMNKGKTYSWFKYASTHYSWATHIAKMDLDTFPFLNRLTKSLHAHLGDRCEHFVGKPVDHVACGQFEHCPPKGCGPPSNGSFLSYKRKRGCWSYMQGGLYLLSTRLATAAVEDGGWWSENDRGIEDLVTGRAVVKVAEERRTCVATWDPEAWDHVPGPAYYYASVSERWDPAAYRALLEPKS